MANKKINKDDVTQFFDYDVHLPTRTIYMGSGGEDDAGNETGVDFRLSERIIKALHMMDQSEGDINIIMNNLGGDVYHGFAIYDAIKERNNFVRIKVYGSCMSIAAAILQAADERVMSKSSRLMVHYGSSSYPETHSKNIEKWVEFSKKFDEPHYEQILLNKIKERKPRFTKKQLTNMLNFDTIVTAEKAVEYGLADKMEE